MTLYFTLTARIHPMLYLANCGAPHVGGRVKSDIKTRRKTSLLGVRGRRMVRRERQNTQRVRARREGEGQTGGLGLSGVLQTDTQPQDTGSN